jgi:hypothetical protein
MRFRSIATMVLTALAIAGCGERSHPTPASNSAERAPSPRAVAGTARADRADIRAVIQRFNRASLAADSRRMCALVDPAKLRYLEQIGQPCELSLGGSLTAESERDVRSATITSVEISGEGAVAHVRGLSGVRDLRLHRRRGHWLILGV